MCIVSMWLPCFCGLSCSLAHCHRNSVPLALLAVEYCECGSVLKGQPFVKPNAIGKDDCVYDREKTDVTEKANDIEKTDVTKKANDIEKTDVTEKANDIEKTDVTEKANDIEKTDVTEKANYSSREL